MRYLKLKIVKKDKFLKKKQVNNFLNKFISSKTSKLDPKLKFYIQKYDFVKIEDKNMCLISFKGRSFNRKFNLSRWELKSKLNEADFNNIKKYSW